MNSIVENVEILTTKGFINSSELNSNHKIYGYNGEFLRINSLLSINKKDYKGYVNIFEGRGYKQTTLMKNDIFYKKPNTQKFDKRNAGGLLNHSKLSLPISFKSYICGRYDISDDMIQLLVVILTDGTINFKNKKRINSQARITIYKSINRWGYKEIPELLTNLNIPFSMHDSTTNSFGEMVQFRIKTSDSGELLKLLNYTKKELPDMFDYFNQEQSKLIIDTWYRLDGSGSDGEKILCQCDNDIIADQLQSVCVKAGYGSNKYIRTFNKFDQSGTCDTTYIRVYARDTRRISKYQSYKISCGVIDIELEFDDMVVARENNTPYILCI